MNILLLLARGTEGTGNTRITIELEEYIKTTNHNVITITGTDKSWGRSKLQDTDFIDYSFSKQGVLKEENIGFKPDICIIMSVPAKKYPKEAIENFLLTLEDMHNNGIRLIYLQVDNKIHSINRNFYGADENYCSRFFNVLDKIIVHHKEADFCSKFLNRKVVPLLTSKYELDQIQLISTDFREVRDTFWKNVNDKIDKTCWFIGRSAAWKGWPQFRAFHYNLLKQNNFISVAEGIERSINAKQAIWTYDATTNTYGELRKDNNYNDDGSPEDIINNPEMYRDHSLEIYGPYIRNEALNRLSKSKFGIFFTYTGPEFGGQLEITFLEIVACGTVPVIRKELFDAANYCGDRLNNYNPNDIGIIVYDENDPEKCLDLLLKLNDDNKLYNEYREKAYSYFKSIFDRSVIMKQLLEMCINESEKESYWHACVLW